MIQNVNLINDHLGLYHTLHTRKVDDMNGMLACSAVAATLNLRAIPRTGLD